MLNRVPLWIRLSACILAWELTTGSYRQPCSQKQSFRLREEFRAPEAYGSPRGTNPRAPGNGYGVFVFRLALAGRRPQARRERIDAPGCREGLSHRTRRGGVDGCGSARTAPADAGAISPIGRGTIAATGCRDRACRVTPRCSGLVMPLPVVRVAATSAARSRR